MVSIHRDEFKHKLTELHEEAEEKKRKLQLCLSEVESHISSLDKRIDELQSSLAGFEERKLEILEVQDSPPGSVVLRTDGLVESIGKFISVNRLPAPRTEETKRVNPVMLQLETLSESCERRL